MLFMKTKIPIYALYASIEQLGDVCSHINYSASRLLKVHVCLSSQVYV